ncbi:sensor domain-containing protein [Mycobacterium sp. SP-6446]|uniref:sensor domain-containing protein n=1 Tax=Mycobacterium sp. SP-6446 TaxID=1834162 RepID=UPI0009FA44D8|nr:sensor domain-containing protein [Mycobacterium sp. SP-6446]
MRWQMTGVTVVATLVLSGCTTTVDGRPANGASGVGASTTLAKAPARVQDADLAQLLLSLDEIRGTMGGPKMVVEKTITQPAGLEGGTFTPAECVGAYFNGMAVTYDGSGLRAFVEQETDEPEPQKLEHGVDQGVASFDDSTAAKAFVARSAEQWRKCDGRLFTAVFSDGAKRPTWRFGETSDSGGIITLPRHVEGTKFWDCARVMASKANIVIDNQVCAYELGDKPTTITKAILAKIPD